MTELSENLKKYLEQKGIQWETQYGGAMARLVNIFDEGFAELIFQKQADNAAAIKSSVDNATKYLCREESNANTMIQKLSKLVDAAKSISEGTVNDAQDVKVLMLFKSLLNAGKEVFGEERMSDSAIESICSSASYIAWRSIMGPKFEEKDSRRGNNWV